MPYTTSNAAEIMDFEFGDAPNYQQIRTEHRVKSQAAQAIYDAHTAAGLSQA